MTPEEEGADKRAPIKEIDEKIGDLPKHLHKDAEASLIWDEYTYRHDLIWKHLIRSTIALIVLITVPYFTKLLASEPLVILGASVLAIGYIIFTIFVLRGELKLYEKIAVLHRKRQHYLFGLHEPTKSDGRDETVKNHFKVKLLLKEFKEKLRKNDFKAKVYIYLGFLTVLVFLASFVNLWRAFWQWRC